MSKKNYPISYEFVLSYLIRTRLVLYHLIRIILSNIEFILRGIIVVYISYGLIPSNIYLVLCCLASSWVISYELVFSYIISHHLILPDLIVRTILSNIELSYEVYGVYCLILVLHLMRSYPIKSYLVLRCLVSSWIISYCPMHLIKSCCKSNVRNFSSYPVSKAFLSRGVTSIAVSSEEHRRQLQPYTHIHTYNRRQG